MKAHNEDLISLMQRIAVSRNEVAKAFGCSPLRLNEILCLPLSKEQHHAVKMAILDAGRWSARKEKIAIAQEAPNDGIRLPNSLRYIERMTAHLMISLPMQPNGRKYTGQGKDYYEGGEA